MESFSKWWLLLTHQSNSTISLQNTANTKFKDWYLDIDGHTGDVILWDHLASGGFWKLNNQGNDIVSLQNTADTKFKDWYLDIDGLPKYIILYVKRRHNS